MMLIVNSVERDREAWDELFKKADPRLKVGNIVQPEGSAHSYIELAL